MSSFVTSNKASATSSQRSCMAERRTSWEGRVDSDLAEMFSLTRKWLGQGFWREGRPFSSTLILKFLTQSDVRWRSAQTSPITQPRSSFWAKGASAGPFRYWRTLWTLNMSRPSRKRISAFGSRLRIRDLLGYSLEVSVMPCRLGRMNLIPVVRQLITLLCELEVLASLRHGCLQLRTQKFFSPKSPQLPSTSLICRQHTDNLSRKHQRIMFLRVTCCSGRRG